MAPRVCVIGAGPSGMAVLRAFHSAEQKGAAIPEIVCYEKQSEWGGLWNYSWRTGLGADGTAVPNSMYRHLWSNGPKECQEFADYSFEEHFGFPIPSYPPREVMLDYITGRAKKSGLLKWVQTNTAVLNADIDVASQQFTVRSTCSGVEKTEIFDYVVCCSGHFSTPNVPEFEGMDSFAGRVVHAHDFRSAEDFESKRILVIGTSTSAEDIASQCYKYGVKSVHCSWRTAPMAYHWPDNFTTVPLLQKITPGTKTCTFKDGSTAEIDAIILCTGYQHYFPFLAQDLRLKTENRLWIDSLHEGVVFPHCPRLMYIGMQNQYFTFSMFDVQAWYARDVILGRLTVPDRSTMDREWQQWREAEKAVEPTADFFDAEANVRYQANYVQRLQAMTDYPAFDIEAVVQLFLEWEHNKTENIMTWRDQAHRSVMTGSMAPVHGTPWLAAYDDSLGNYVGGSKPGALEAARK